MRLHSRGRLCHIHRRADAKAKLRAWRAVPPTSAFGTGGIPPTGSEYRLPYGGSDHLNAELRTPPNLRRRKAPRAQPVVPGAVPRKRGTASRDRACGYKDGILHSRGRLCHIAGRADTNAGNLLGDPPGRPYVSRPVLNSQLFTLYHLLFTFYCNPPYPHTPGILVLQYSHAPWTTWFSRRLME